MGPCLSPPGKLRDNGERGIATARLSRDKVKFAVRLHVVSVRDETALEKGKIVASVLIPIRVQDCRYFTSGVDRSYFVRIVYCHRANAIAPSRQSLRIEWPCHFIAGSPTCDLPSPDSHEQDATQSCTTTSNFSCTVDRFLCDWRYQAQGTSRVGHCQLVSNSCVHPGRFSGNLGCYREQWHAISNVDHTQVICHYVFTKF